MFKIQLAKLNGNDTPSGGSKHYLLWSGFAFLDQAS